MTSIPGCLVERCRGSVDPAAPLRLCERHLVVASEWAGRSDGVTDLLPSPCALCGSRLGVRWPSGWSCAVCEWRHGDVVDDELPPPRVDVVYYLGYYGGSSLFGWSLGYVFDAAGWGVFLGVVVAMCGGAAVLAIGALREH